MAKLQKPGAVVVTGASTGIGKVTALHLDRLGFKVFATVRNESDAKGLTCFVVTALAVHLPL